MKQRPKRSAGMLPERDNPSPFISRMRHVRFEGTGAGGALAFALFSEPDASRICVHIAAALDSAPQNETIGKIF